MSAASASKLRSRLEKRAEALSRVRAFFNERNVLEVDCPALERCAAIDAHIDPIHAGSGYLHTSPEYGMKKLLAEGSGDIYQLSHVFRREETGALHTEEFTMLEWYRTSLSFGGLIEETCALISTLVPGLSFEEMSYQAAFERYVCPIDAPSNELLKHLNNLSPEIAADRSALIDLCFSEQVEPNLPRGCIITEFPKETAALACMTTNATGMQVAERFEVYINGVEIANGYNELRDSRELRERFERANEERSKLGKASYPLDEALLRAIETMPPCVGVALGFDRLLMLALGAESVSSVQAAL